MRVVLAVDILGQFVLRHDASAMPQQKGVFFSIGRVTHYLILADVAAMLISGPMMVWSRGAWQARQRSVTISPARRRRGPASTDR